MWDWTIEINYYLLVMIKYKLVCKNCGNFFDSWFASSKEYENLKKLKHVNCGNCNSLKVEKTLMTPSILNSKKEKAPTGMLPASKGCI